MKEELYLGKKVSELNIHEQLFRKMMQLMRVHKLLEKAEQENRQISYQERDPNILWDDYPIEGLILVEKDF